MGTDGTARRIGPVADNVLAFVADKRAHREHPRPGVRQITVTDDDLRGIELCALAAREASMFHDLYGLEGNGATAPEVPE